MFDLRKTYCINRKSTILRSWLEIYLVSAKADPFVIIVSSWLRTHNLSAQELKKHKFFTYVARDSMKSHCNIFFFSKKSNAISDWPWSCCAIVFLGSGLIMICYNAILLSRTAIVWKSGFFLGFWISPGNPSFLIVLFRLWVDYDLL